MKYQGVDPLSKQSHFNYKDRKEVLDFTSNRKKLLEREQIELEKMKEHQFQVIQEKQKGTPPIGQKYMHSQLGKSNEADSEGEAGVEADENSFNKKSHKYVGRTSSKQQPNQGSGGPRSSKSNYSSPVLPPSSSSMAVTKTTNCPLSQPHSRSNVNSNDLQQYLKILRYRSITKVILHQPLAAWS